jgi:acyl-CoA synthetase (AMP-forming)/AMP-acid ligase II
MNCVDYFFENTSNLQKDLIIGTTEKINYLVAYERTILIANFLTNKIGTGKKVLLVSQNSIFWMTTYLGILKSGNICVPLNPSIEQKNFDFIAEKTQCELVFISDIALKKLTVSIEKYSELNYPSDFSSLTTKSKKTNKFDGNQIAEIIFTSGSTSTPKGVLLTHNNIIANTNSIIQYLNLNENDIIQIVLPFYYCYGLSLLHTHLRVGGQIVVNNNFIFLASTIDNINKYHCTGFAGVPSHFQILLRKTDLFKNTFFTSLRYVTQAGGKLHNIFINEFVSTFPSIQFITMYGQTEATARLSYLPSQMIYEKTGSIGKAIPDVELRVVDEGGESVVPGQIGEIIAKGNNIMAGYLNDPIETSHAIRNGWLYTGDLGTVVEDGYIYLTSRIKEIIKVGGKRVSPKEIEEVITMIPEVIDCSIEAFQDELLGEGIKSTIVINEKGKHITAEYIRNYCGSQLSAHKIPTIIEFKESMNINTTGKKVKKL